MQVILVCLSKQQPLPGLVSAFWRQTYPQWDGVLRPAAILTGAKPWEVSRTVWQMPLVRLLLEKLLLLSPLWFQCWAQIRLCLFLYCTILALLKSVGKLGVFCTYSYAVINIWVNNYRAGKSKLSNVSLWIQSCISANIKWPSKAKQMLMFSWWPY